MKKARIIVVGILAIVLILGLIGWWFWSLGSIAKVEQPVLRLVVVQGGVFIKSGGALEEQAKSGEIVAKGDIVRTASGGKASIVAEGRSDLRLSENTEVEIGEVNLNWAQNYVLKFKLKSGRVWSRVMKLLDLESTHEGQTDNVVATVRGTAFAMEKGGDETKLFVDHSAVGTPLHNGMGENVFTKDGWAFFDNEGRVMLSGHIASSTWPDMGWIEEERKADERFTAAAQKSILESLGGNDAVAMDNWAYGLSRYSEKWHLRFSGDGCKDMTARYMGKQLYNVYDLIQRGKSGLAFQHLSELEKDFGNEKSCAEIIDFADPVGKMLLALSDVAPESDLYKLKLRFEEIYISLYAENSPEAYWARALALDARLDELERFGCRPDFREPMQQAIDAVEQGLARQDRNFEFLPAEMDDAVRIALSNKTHVQHVRFENFMERLEWCRLEDMRPDVSDSSATSTTSTNMETATSTDSSSDADTGRDTTDRGTNTEPPALPDTIIETKPPVQPDVNQTGALDLQSIQLFAQPNPVLVGGISNLYVKGFKKDGSEIDVTGRASFEQIGNLGTLFGSTYTANSPGSVTIIARVNDGGQEFASQVSLRINEPMVLSYLEISGGAQQVSQGTSRQINVVAHYTNGELKTVTPSANYTVSNTQIGTMRGSVFYASPNGLGSVTVIVQYTESGVTKQSEINYEVVAGNYTTVQ